MVMLEVVNLDHLTYILSPDPQTCVHRLANGLIRRLLD